MTETIVLQQSSPDGQHELRIARLDSGRYRFTVWSMRDGPEVTGPGLAPSYTSGQYDSLAAADADARARLYWLQPDL